MPCVVLKNLLGHYYCVSRKHGKLHSFVRQILYKCPLIVQLYKKLILEPSLPNEDIVLLWDSQQILLENPRQNIISQDLFLKGAWEPEVTKYIGSRIASGMTAIDVGADTGYYTLLFAKRVRRLGRVIAFEPIPSARKVLEDNIRLNGYTNVTVCDFALFSSNGLVALESPRILSRIDPTKTTNIKTGISIRTRTFDECVSELEVQRIDLVKIDVEGAELDVLLGMKNSLDKYHPALLIEVHPDHIGHFGHSIEHLVRFLEDMEYSIEPVDKPTPDFGSGNITIFCT